MLLTHVSFFGKYTHADSLGAAGRYGEGDVQWMTAGAGVQHSEMFPLLKQDQENVLELFQIWINLPKKSLNQGRSQVTLIAGNFKGQFSPAPPPSSWASDSENKTLILLIKIQEGSSFQLDPEPTQVSRVIYFFSGKNLRIKNKPGAEGRGFPPFDEIISSKTGIKLDPSELIDLQAEGGDAEILLLQAKPILEPVVQHGPFVMNTQAEIRKTLEDYHATQFGGWPFTFR